MSCTSRAMAPSCALVNSSIAALASALSYAAASKCVIDTLIIRNCYFVNLIAAMKRQPRQPSSSYPLGLHPFDVLVNFILDLTQRLEEPHPPTAATCFALPERAASWKPLFCSSIVSCGLKRLKIGSSRIHANSEAEREQPKQLSN